MTFLAYAAAAAIGLLFSYMGLVFAITGGLQTAYLVGALLLLAYAGVIFYVVRQARGGKGPRAAFALVLPMFLVTGALQVFQLGKYAFSLVVPDSEAFLAECKSSGAKYFKRPIAPVRSIAYDWNTKSNPPFNRFEIQLGTRIASRGRSNLPHPNSIEFVERKRSSLEGRPSRGPDGPYIRFPQTGDYYAITSLTADVLVHYEITPEEELRKAEVDQGIVRYEVTVTDRRTDEQLATLKYVIDAKQRRGCGLTGEKEMSERAFVLRATGLE